jgi:hypothetical protein
MSIRHRPLTLLNPISEVRELVLVLVVVLVLDLLGFLRRKEGRFSSNYFVRSVSRWDIQLLEHEQEHEHGFSISEFRLNGSTPPLKGGQSSAQAALAALWRALGLGALVSSAMTMRKE